MADTPTPTIPAGSGGPDDDSDGPVRVVDPDEPVRVLLPGGGQLMVPAELADQVAHLLVPARSPAIYGAIAKVMAEVGGIAKGDQAPSQMGGYQYRGIESMTRKLQTLCGQHGVIIWPAARVVEAPPSIGMKEGWLDWRVEVTWSVAGVDGIALDPPPVTVGIGRDNVDKGINKAMTAAYKYLLLQLFMVSDGKDDTDAQDYSAGRREEPSQPVQHYIDQATHDRLRSELQSLPTETREQIRAAWAEVDPMTGEPFLPLEPDGKPSIRLLFTTMVPAVEGMIARARKGDRPLPGGGPAEASESPQEASDGDPGTDTAGEPETATESPAGDPVDEAIAKAEQSGAEAKAAAGACAECGTGGGDHAPGCSLRPF